MDLTREQLRAAADLTQEELAFANYWLKRDENGWTIQRCVAESHPNYDPEKKTSLTSKGTQLLHQNDRVRRYINAINAEALRQATYDRSRIIKMFMRQAESAEEKLDPFVEWRFVENDKGNIDRMAWVESSDVITDNKLTEFVTGFTRCDTGGYYVIYREIVDEKTRVRAAEMLAKVGGEFIEQVTMASTNTNIGIDATDPTKASQDYMQLMGAINNGK